ncbi:CLUMA_CG013886, isoform A [Clunio marinus]|uniref:CLUMA_CG013886, isoform A n=1 Tax=Clunio marinus TaxID=568069 RepID=A0A1J1ILJ1_9DIPT|nr:CLUMA_CG013886, isoform A [Clunio marinus]
MRQTNSTRQMKNGLQKKSISCEDGKNKVPMELFLLHSNPVAFLTLQLRIKSRLFCLLISFSRKMLRSSHLKSQF